MDNNSNDKKFKGKTIFLVSLMVISLAYIIGSTYAASQGYKVVFNRYEDTEVMKTCRTNAAGKLDNDCLSAINDVCSSWSSYSKNDSNKQSDDSYTVDQLKNKVFTEDKNMYCVSGTSKQGYDKGCYVCKSNSNIMKWKFNTKADDDCSGGYEKDTSINEENCVSVVPDSCYVCDADSNVMKWDNNGDGDSECSGGYSKTDKAESECVTIVPSACYVCRNDSNIMKWDNDPSGDSKCSSGYTPVAKSESECVPVENPKTGNILIFFVWVLGITTLCYSIYYFKNKLTN